MIRCFSTFKQFKMTSFQPNTKDHHAQATTANPVATAFAATLGSRPLKVEVFNPGEAAIFPVASVLVSAPRMPC
jgi:hypothetical protein